MHISLDSALGQQRRLNSVGESITQIAPDPAAAYSLRSLTGGDPKVVRVRRASDNHEQDFTASDVSSGALTSFVNTQVTPPLDIQALSATGRDGDFLIAKAAYSLRSLGTRQATLAATGDTVARANGKFVAQVRRSSDDALKSFTAAEVTDGTLRNFCLNDDSNLIRFADAGLAGSPTTDKRMYFDGVNDYVESNTTTDASSDFFIKVNLVWFGDRDQIIFTDRASERLINLQVDDSSDKVRVQVATSDGYQLLFDSATDLPKFKVVEVMLQHTASTKTQELFFDGVSQGSGNYTGTITPANKRAIQIGSEQSGSGRFFKGIISDFNYNNETIQLGYGSTSADWEDTFGSNNGTVVGSPAIFTGQGFDGFVKTWYDQSVTTQAGDTATGNHATQATAANQPKIVSAGSLLTKGLTFDGTDDSFILTSTLGQTNLGSYFIVSEVDTISGSNKFMFDNRDSGTDGTLVYAASDEMKLQVTGTNVGVDVDTSTSLTSAFRTGSNQTIGINGGTLSSASNTDTVNVTTIPKIGTRSFSTELNFMKGEIAELIVYNTDQTDNRTAIEANIGEAYSITGIPAYDNTVDGFVETWYDQSGNGNDLTQATAANQPTIVSAGVLNTRNNKPIVKFIQANSTFLQVADSSMLPTGSNIAVTIFHAMHIDVSSGSRIGVFGNNGGGNNAQANTYRFGSGTSRRVTVKFGDASSTQVEVLSGFYTNDSDSVLTYQFAVNGGTASLQAFNNGSSLSSNSASTTDQSYSPVSDSIILGARSTADNFSDSEFFEIIAYGSDQLSNRSAIETNINNQYSIF